MPRPKYSLRSLLILLTLASAHLAVCRGDPRLIAIVAPWTSFVVATASYRARYRESFFDAIVHGTIWATGITAAVGGAIWPLSKGSVPFDALFARVTLAFNFAIYGYAVCIVILLVITAACIASCVSEYVWLRLGPRKKLVVGRRPID